MRYALHCFDEDTDTMLILAYLAISAWLGWQGESPPTAVELSCIFPTVDDWLREVECLWPQCSAGRPLTQMFRTKAKCFWATLHTLRTRSHEEQADSIAKDSMESLALLRAKDPHRRELRQMLTVTDHVPIEVRKSKYRLPGTESRKLKQPTAEANALTAGESFLLWLCSQAKHFSKHSKIIQHQCSMGSSDHFPSTWRNLIGNPTEAAVQALIHSWRRWKTHTLNSPAQWSWIAETEALFRPSSGALAHYAGERSLGGATAARGAMAGLWRLSVALGLEFPFEESGVNGWTNRLKDHIIQPKIPFEVAQLAHFDILARDSTNPFILVGCASVWFAFLGMCRDAHIQRSFLTKRCKEGWLFHCVKGKDKGKP